MYPEGAPDMQALLEQASAMQQQLAAAQAELAEVRVTGDAGGGLVTATVDGTGELVSLDISPQACDPGDADTLADLVVAAIRAASASAAQEVTRQMGDLTASIGGALGGEFGGAGGLLGEGASGTTVADRDDDDPQRPGPDVQPPSP